MSIFLHVTEHRVTSSAKTQVKISLQFFERNYQLMTARVLWSTDPLPEFEPVGCFKDNLSDRALPENCASFRSLFDSRCHNINVTIRQCALVARDIGYEYFAVQYHGECWSSFDTVLTYGKHGVETNPNKCWANVGTGSTNYV